MRRKHHKILDLPAGVVDAVNSALARGATYEDIVRMLRDMGHEVGKSSVGRYGKEFLARLERIRVVQEQAKAVLEETQGEPLRTEEATTQIALSMIAETLLALPDMRGAKPVELVRALAHLQSSSASRERLRMGWRAEQQARAQQAAAEVGKVAKAGGLSDETIRQIEERILGIAA